MVTTNTNNNDMHVGPRRIPITNSSIGQQPQSSEKVPDKGVSRIRILLFVLVLLLAGVLLRIWFLETKQHDNDYLSEAFCKDVSFSQIEAQRKIAGRRAVVVAVDTIQAMRSMGHDGDSAIVGVVNRAACYGHDEAIMLAGYLEEFDLLERSMRHAFAKELRIFWPSKSS